MVASVVGFGYLEDIRCILAQQQYPRLVPPHNRILYPTMKFLSSTLATLSLSIIAALATPETSPAGALERRAQKCRVNADGARCRRTPSLSADAIGEFFVGDVCFSIPHL
jgi:hypothetical protein